MFLGIVDGGDNSSSSGVVGVTKAQVLVIIYKKNAKDKGSKTLSRKHLFIIISTPPGNGYLHNWKSHTHDKLEP